MRAPAALTLLAMVLPFAFAPSAPSNAPSPQAPAAFDGQSNGMVDAATHGADLDKFEAVETIPDGLGPIYNAQSCRECHQNPVSGGASQISELRVGHLVNGKFQNPDIPIARGTQIIRGRTLVNDRAICPNGAFPDKEVQERVPEIDKVRTFRLSVNLLGDGFVEAVADQVLAHLAKEQCQKSHRQICGVAVRVPILEAPGQTGIGRFGWKDQHASLLSFAGDAYLNEMGITNKLFPDEVTTICNTVSEPNDTPGNDGLADIDHFARFVRATEAPARDAQQAGTAAARQGEMLFAKIGCDTCHVSTLTTAAAGTVINGGKFTIPDALGGKTFHPYSDFLLHDVGTGDGIAIPAAEHYGKHVHEVQWRNFSPENLQATTNRMRTAPLWGVRLQPMLMHDGASLTLLDAIRRHQGEASRVIERFERLSHAEQEAIVEFLKSL